MEKVPHDVPVEKARNNAIPNMIAGMKILAVALEPTVPFTKSAIPRLSPIPFKVHAKVRIRIAGSISFAPSTKEFMNSLKETTFLGRYSKAIKIMVMDVAKIKLISASQLANASIMFVEPPKIPV